MVAFGTASVHRTFAFALAPAQARLQLQVGTDWVVVLLLLVFLAGVLITIGLMLWGLYALTKWVLSAERGTAVPPSADDWQALSGHPDIETTERYGEGAPEVETVVRDRRRVARLETAPGGTDRYAVLQTAMLSVRAGTGFELAETAQGHVEYVDRGPDVPTLSDEVWSEIAGLDVFGGLTVDDRTGVVEHRFPAPDVVTQPEILLRQAEVLVDVAEAVETHAETATETPAEPAEPAKAGPAAERSER